MKSASHGGRRTRIRSSGGRCLSALSEPLGRAYSRERLVARDGHTADAFSGEGGRTVRTAQGELGSSKGDE